jgi:hypothetical protein
MENNLISSRRISSSLLRILICWTIESSEYNIFTSTRQRETSSLLFSFRFILKVNFHIHEGASLKSIRKRNTRMGWLFNDSSLPQSNWICKHFHSGLAFCSLFSNAVSLWLRIIGGLRTTCRSKQMHSISLASDIKNQPKRNETIGDRLENCIESY